MVGDKPTIFSLKKNANLLHLPRLIRLLCTKEVSIPMASQLYDALIEAQVYGVSSSRNSETVILRP